MVLGEEDSAKSFETARKAFADGFYEVASQHLQKYLKTDPRGIFAKEAHLLLGQSYFYLQNYQKALYEFEVVIGWSGVNEFKDQALYWMGEVNFTLKDYNNALLYFERLAEEFPDSPMIEETFYSRDGAILIWAVSKRPSKSSGDF
jgi:TolA-binding protein